MQLIKKSDIFDGTLHTCLTGYVPVVNWAFTYLQRVN